MPELWRIALLFNYYAMPMDITIFEHYFSDKTKPEIEFLPKQPTISDGDMTLLWKTSSGKPATFECAYNDVSRMQPCGEGTKGSWSDKNIPDGDHVLYVRAKDAFGAYGQIKTHGWKVGKLCINAQPSASCKTIRWRNQTRV